MHARLFTHCYFAVCRVQTAANTPRGGGQGDPIFTGFDGRVFEFLGNPESFYNIISERHHQVHCVPSRSIIFPSLAYLPVLPCHLRGCIPFSTNIVLSVARVSPMDLPVKQHSWSAFVPLTGCASCVDGAADAVLKPVWLAEQGLLGQEALLDLRRFLLQVSTKLKVGVMWDHNGTYMEGYGFQYRDHGIIIELDADDDLTGGLQSTSFKSHLANLSRATLSSHRNSSKHAAVHFSSSLHL